MWREILRIINEATVDGLVQGNYDTNIDKTFLEKLAHSNEVFSAFKVHDMGVDMAKKMRTDEGKLKPFSEWKKDIKSIASHYCGAWLQTEYNTATLRAKFAAEWKQYEADADIMPNLRWMPTTSANPEEEHKVYWMNRLTLPVGDRFWDKHHPGDHWNCKCSLEQTDEPANPDVLSHIPDVKAQKGLAANPGKTGEMFDRSHPYYEQKCSKCWGNKNKSFKNAVKPSENCNKCPLMNECTEKAKQDKTTSKNNIDVAPPHLETYDKEGEHVFVSQLNKEAELPLNVRMAHFLADKTDENVYVLPHIQPTQKGAEAMRRKYFPEGVKENKNPDIFFRGRFVDAKSMKEKDIRIDQKKQAKHNIQNKLSSGFEQADDVFIEIPTTYPKEWVSEAIKGKLKSCENKHIVYVKYGDNLFVFE